MSSLAILAVSKESENEVSYTYINDIGLAGVGLWSDQYIDEEEVVSEINQRNESQKRNKEMLVRHDERFVGINDFDNRVVETIDELKTIFNESSVNTVYIFMYDEWHFITKDETVVKNRVDDTWRGEIHYQHGEWFRLCSQVPEFVQ